MTDTQLQITDSQFEQIGAVVYKHCGIHMHEGKRDLVQARMAKRMRIRSIADVSEYLHMAMNDRGEFTHLIDAMSTNLTSFFRESQHFDHLEKQFLPELLKRKRAAKDRTLRGWSAGCSTGEEPYTIGMTLLGAIDAAEWDVKLLATDLSTAVLATARAGIYDHARVESIPPQFRNRFTAPVKDHDRRAVSIGAEVRSLIRFAHLNLMEQWPFRGPFDFIFCRNVMIYFDKPTQQRLIERFWQVLASGGLLFTGHSESLTGIDHRFNYVQPTIYEKP